VQGAGCRVQGAGFRVQGLSYGLSSMKCRYRARRSIARVANHSRQLGHEFGVGATLAWCRHPHSPIQGRTRELNLVGNQVVLSALNQKHALLLRVPSLVQVDDALLEERLEAV